MAPRKTISDVENPLELHREISDWRMVFRLATWIMRDDDRPRWVRWQYCIMLASILLQVYCVTLFVKNNGAFMKIMSDKNQDEFWPGIFKFSQIVTSFAIVFGINAFLKERMIVQVQDWITNKLLARYCRDANYYKLERSDALDNPGLRIVDDTAKFVTAVHETTIVLFTKQVQAVAFVYTLWETSPLLSCILLAYATVGLLIGYYFYLKMTRYSEKVSECTAELRAGVCRLGEDAESVAFYRAGKCEHTHLVDKVDDMIEAAESFANWSGATSTFTTLYGENGYIISFLVLEKQYFAGAYDFAVLSTAQAAFNRVLFGMFEVLNKLKSCSNISANAARIYAAVRVLDRQENMTTFGDDEVKDKNTVKTATISESVQMSNVTICPPKSHKILVENLNLDHKPGQSLLLMGPSGAGKSSVLRTICGLWKPGKGCVSRPDNKDMLFLPQNTYVPEIKLEKNTLKAQLLFPRTEGDHSDEELLKTLEKVNLGFLAGKARNIHITGQWRQILSVGERQRLAMARLLLASPKVAFLDESTSALDCKNEALMYSTLTKKGCSYISVGHRPDLMKYHSHILEIEGNGKWNIHPSPMYDTANLSVPALTEAGESSAVAFSG